MTRKILLSSAALLLVLAACGDDDDGSARASGSASGSGSASAAVAGCEVVDGSSEDPTGSIDVTLAEYSITAPAEVDSGVITINATNDGSIAHEVVVLAVPPSDIEVGDDGAPVEDGLIGEIEAFAAGETCDGAFALSPGEYTLLCAIVEESGESHYGEGMVTALTVT